MNLSSDGEYWNDNIRSTPRLSPTPNRTVYVAEPSLSRHQGTTSQQLTSSTKQSHVHVGSDCLAPFHGRSSKPSIKVREPSEFDWNMKFGPLNSSPKKSTAFSPKAVMKSSLSRSNSSDAAFQSPAMASRRKLLVPVHSRSSPGTLTPRRKRLQHGKQQELEVDWSRCGLADDPPGTNFDDDAIYRGFFGDDADTSTQHTPSSSSHTGSTFTNTISPSSRAASTPQPQRKRSTVTTTRSSHYSSSPVSESTNTSITVPSSRRGGVGRSRSRRMNALRENSPSIPTRNSARLEEDGGPVIEVDATHDDADGAAFARIDFRQIDQLFLFPFEEGETSKAAAALPPTNPPSRRIGVKRSNSHRRPGSHRQSTLMSSDGPRIPRRPSNDSSSEFAPPFLSKLVSDQARIPYHRSMTKRLKDQEEQEREKLLLQIRNRSSLPTNVARPPTPPRQRRVSALPSSPGRSRRPPASPRRAPPIHTECVESEASAERSPVRSYGLTAKPSNQGRRKLGHVFPAPVDDVADDRTDIFGTNVDQLSAFDDSFTELITWTRYRK